IHGSGRLVAALCGSMKHALNHKAAGVDIIIAQGTEGGGHTGDIGSIVLWPEVIDAVAPTPVLAAGGIGSGRAIAAALAMGAQGVWTGSLWLTVREADVPPAQLGMPLQFMVTMDAVQRGHRYPEQAKQVNFNPVGQVVGQMNEIESVK